jgi:hypothetical protein
MRVRLNAGFWGVGTDIRHWDIPSIAVDVDSFTGPSGAGLEDWLLARGLTLD